MRKTSTTGAVRRVNSVAFLWESGNHFFLESFTLSFFTWFARLPFRMTDPPRYVILPSFALGVADLIDAYSKSQAHDISCKRRVLFGQAEFLHHIVVERLQTPFLWVAWIVKANLSSVIQLSLSCTDVSSWSSKILRRREQWTLFSTSVQQFQVYLVIKEISCVL